MQRRAGALDLQQLLVDALARGLDRVADQSQLVERGLATVLLQPQALAQHLVHRFTHGIVVATGDRLDLVAGGAQPRFQAVGGVQHLGHGALAIAAAPATGQQAQGEGQGRDGQQSEGQGQDAGPLQRTSSLPRAGPGGKFPRQYNGLTALSGSGESLTGAGTPFNILRLMSAEVPEILDAWRMVSARRGFEGRLPLSSMPRLGEVLPDTEGEVAFALDFDRDALQVAFVELRIDAVLPLQCQRTLQRFLLPVHIVQRLGLLPADADEADEAALPPGYEALLVAGDGMLRPAELVEDELILAVPVVPVMPGSEAVERDWPVPADEEMRANPFSALQSLKKTESKKKH